MCVFALHIPRIKVLCKQPLWNNLLVHFQQHGCLVEGTLGALRQHMIHLHKPKPLSFRVSHGQICAFVFLPFQPARLLLTGFLFFNTPFLCTLA